MSEPQAVSYATLPPAPSAGVATARNRRLLILVCTFAAYLPALRADFIWDDDKYVSENANLHSVEGLKGSWLNTKANPQYYPMVFTTFWVEHAVWGNSPAGYHLTNIILHALNAMLVLQLLETLGVPGALWAALIFAIHPVHVESVAWITERKNVLSGFFYLLSLAAYLRFDRDRESGQHDWRFFAAALLLYAGALCSKTVTCSLPAAILLILWWKRGRLTWRDVMPLIPMFAIGAILAGMTIWIEKVHVGASGQDWHLSPIERCLVAGRDVWFYLGKLVWPVTLIFIYPRWNVDAGQVLQYVYPLALIATLIALWQLRDRIGRGPLVAMLFFIGTLGPALGFVDVYPFRFSFVADHFQYLASLGPIVLAASIVATLAQPLSQKRGMSVVLVVLAVLTFCQCFIYQSRDTLWSDTRNRNPSAWIAHNNLGFLREQQGRFEEARTLYAQAVALKPDCMEVNNNLGSMLIKQDHPAEAIPYLRAAHNAEPKNVAVIYNIGVALAKLGRRSEAIAAYRETIALKPDYADAHFNLAGVLTEDKQPLAAIEEYRKAIDLKPKLRNARLLLADLLIEVHRPEEAIAPLRAVLRDKPRDIEAQKRLDEAIKLSRQGNAASKPVRP